MLVVFQARDAVDKDSTIKHVMTGVNPQGVQVASFKQPSSEELDHTFLWRTAKAVPERGRVGIFNRSHYEEVVALRVHPEWLAKQLWKFNASDLDDRAVWDDYVRAYDDAITGTLTAWYVLPADDKKVMQTLAAAVIVHAIQSLDCVGRPCQIPTARRTPWLARPCQRRCEQWF